MSKANTNIQCSSFFNEYHKLSHLATMEVLKENSSEESYLKYRAGYEKNKSYQQKVQFLVEAGYVKKEEVDAKKIMNIAMMGTLGEINDLVYNVQTGRYDIRLNKYFYDKRKNFISQKLKLLNDIQITREERKVLYNRVQILQGDADVVFVKISSRNNNVLEGTPQDQIAKKLMLEYIFAVNWIYRISGLEPNSAMSNAKMMDEVSAYANRLYLFDYYMVYDRKIWSNLEKSFAYFYREFNAAPTAAAQKAVIESFESEREGFLPLAGLVLTEHYLNKNAPSEFKRYFKNEFEDPFNLLSLKKKNDHILRMKLIKTIVESKSNKKIFEIHAHTETHVQQYLKLGFEVISEIKNPKFPGAKVYLLQAKKNQIIPKINSILGKHQE
ncbi:MAG: hypothetical protein ACK41T_04640 [Pseudobdellovibrio sp.]